MRSYLSQVRMAIILKADDDVEEKRTFLHCGDVRWGSHYGKHSILR